MFGYVKPFVPELKVAQHEIYNALYCGLCRAMGKVTGQASRLTLSYDLVFLAAVRMIIEDEKLSMERFTCLAHPFRKKAVVLPNDSLEFTAAMSAVLAYAKNKDDLADEKGMKKFCASVLAPFLGCFSSRGGKNLPDGTAEKISGLLERLTELENASCPSADETAEAFGAVLGEAFRVGLDGDRASLAYRIGKSTGRFVYLCDACDDMVDDIRKHRYNPLAAGWGELAVDRESGEMSPLVKNSVLTALPIDLEILGEAVEELNPAHVLTPIVKNIVYLGMVHAMEKAAGQESFEKNKTTTSI